MSERVYFYLDKSNNSVGPFSISQISQKIVSFEIEENTFLWSEGFATWLEAKNVGDFQDTFSELKARRKLAYQRNQEIAEKKKRDEKAGCYGCLLAPIILFIVLAVFQKGCETVQSSLAKMSIKKTEVTESKFGDRWPLTVSSGQIYKIERDYGRIAVIFVAPDGTEYGLNGTAQTMGYRDIHEITKQYRDSSDTTFLYRDVSELIGIGLDTKK